MRQLYPLLLFFFIASCKHVSEPKTIRYGQVPTDSAWADPYFVETEDTSSPYGPYSITRSVLQDRNGNIWFATWQGIISYDGNLFTNYTLKENLIKFHVFSVLEERTGNLWFGSIGGGVYRYDGKNFTLFTTKHGLASNVVTCMLEDKSGNIWLGTDNGVSRFDGRTLTFTNFTKEQVLSGNSVNSIMQDKTGKLWFGTRGGVTCYEGNSFTLFTNKKEGRSFHNARSIVENKTGNIWIGSEEGLCQYNPASGELTNFKNNFIGNIFEDKAGNLWLSEGENKGMALYRYDGKSFTKITTKFYNQVFGATEDRDGNVWFGTESGVCRYDGKSFTDFLEDVSGQ